MCPLCLVSRLASTTRCALSRRSLCARCGWLSKRPRAVEGRVRVAPDRDQDAASVASVGKGAASARASRERRAESAVLGQDSPWMSAIHLVVLRPPWSVGRRASEPLPHARARAHAHARCPPPSPRRPCIIDARRR